MTGVKFKILIASTLLAGLAAPAAAAQAPVGSLCNADGRIEVFGEVAATTCGAEPEKEMKALLKASAEYQGTFGLSPEKKMQIDARIERRIRELRKLKAAKAAS